MSAQLPTMAENMAASEINLNAIEATWKRDLEDKAAIIAENVALREEIARLRIKLAEKYPHLDMPS